MIWNHNHRPHPEQHQITAGIVATKFGLGFVIALYAQVVTNTLLRLFERETLAIDMTALSVDNGIHRLCHHFLFREMSGMSQRVGL
jgi:hypothetical protein